MQCTCIFVCQSYSRNLRQPLRLRLRGNFFSPMPDASRPPARTPLPRSGRCPPATVDYTSSFFHGPHQRSPILYHPQSLEEFSLVFDQNIQMKESMSRSAHRSHLSACRQKLTHSSRACRIECITSAHSCSHFRKQENPNICDISNTEYAIPRMLSVAS